MEALFPAKYMPANILRALTKEQLVLLSTQKNTKGKASENALRAQKILWQANGHTSGYTGITEPLTMIEQGWKIPEEKTIDLDEWLNGTEVIHTDCAWKQKGEKMYTINDLFQWLKGHYDVRLVFEKSADYDQVIHITMLLRHHAAAQTISLINDEGNSHKDLPEILNEAYQNLMGIRYDRLDSYLDSDVEEIRNAVHEIEQDGDVTWE